MPLPYALAPQCQTGAYCQLLGYSYTSPVPLCAATRLPRGEYLVGDCLMIGFRPALECREHVDRGLPDVELVDVPSHGRAHQCDQVVVFEAHLLARVQVEIPGLGRDAGPRKALGVIECVISVDQASVDGISQVREIQAPERSVPVRTVTLSAIELLTRGLAPPKR